MNPTTTGRFRVLGSPRDTDEWLFVDVTDPESDDPTDRFDPTYVPREGNGDFDEGVATLRPGYLVEATLTWDDGRPRVSELDVVERTLFEFVDEATTVFQAARETWAGAAAAGEGMNSQVTYSTDGEANGVLYVFAEQPGAQDLFEEFRSGIRPIEPLLERVDEANVKDGDETDDEGLTEGDDRNEPAVPGGIDREGGQTDDEPTVRLDPSAGVVVDTGEDPVDANAREVFVIRPADEPFLILYIVLQKGSLLAETVRDTYGRPTPQERLD
jgi:hypothetical protein